MIIGRDVLTDLGIDIKFSTNSIEWEDSEIPMKDAGAPLTESYYIGDGDIADEALERIKGILDAKYEHADLEEVAGQAEHLTPEERRKLLELLTKYEDLFDGTLGHWTSEKV